jgi:hypothetical protein
VLDDHGFPTRVEGATRFSALAKYGMLPNVSMIGNSRMVVETAL